MLKLLCRMPLSCAILLNVVMRNDLILSHVMFIVIMLNNVMLSVVKLNVVMLNVAGLHLSTFWPIVVRLFVIWRTAIAPKNQLFSWKTKEQQNDLVIFSSNKYVFACDWRSDFCSMTISSIDILSTDQPDRLFSRWRHLNP
jgi:hypothetical protein